MQLKYLERPIASLLSRVILNGVNQAETKYVWSFVCDMDLFLLDMVFVKKIWSWKPLLLDLAWNYVVITSRDVVFGVCLWKFYTFRSFWNLETSLFQYLYYSWRRYSDSLFEAMLGSSLLLLGKLPAGKYKSNRIENKKMKIAQKKQMLEDQETASIKVKEA